MISDPQVFQKLYQDSIEFLYVTGSKSNAHIAIWIHLCLGHDPIQPLAYLQQTAVVVAGVVAADPYSLLSKASINFKIEAEKNRNSLVSEGSSLCPYFLLLNSYKIDLLPSKFSSLEQIGIILFFSNCDYFIFLS